jgi:hypothetical protein
MATGRLGANALSATTDTSVYTCPSATFAVVTVSICNRNSADSRNIRLALASTGTPTTAEYLEYDVELVASGVLERTGIVLAAGQRIVVYASAGDITAVVYGIETSTV